ncbi:MULTISPECIES: hypothetical protein [Nocardiaceae]|uniref:hypothetical protein n=1 Tax=Nocardiaceae TaxID=85025 RepID=UPI000A40BFD9|nr:MULTISPECIES: hypothetical protein [Rhodococcus]
MDTTHAVFCGMDVEKSYHAVGLAVDGIRLYDKALPTTRLVYAQFSSTSPRTDLC